MSRSIQISASMVLYNPDAQELKNAVQSFLKLPYSKTLFLIDNSPNPINRKLFNLEEIEHIIPNRNIGFAAGHNLVLDRIEGYSDFHLVLNSDVTFSADVLKSLVFEFQNDPDLFMCAPKVLFPDGRFQESCRKYPTVFSQLKRFLGLGKSDYQEDIYKNPFSPDFLHGCFLLFRTDCFLQLKGFDERYFMYMEDVDIARRIDESGGTKLYVPSVQIMHGLKRGSSKHMKLFYHHLRSMYRYYKKWGLKF